MSKVYHPPVTPYGRLLASTEIPESVKEQLRLQFAALDPIQLLREIRRLQAELMAKGQAGKSDPSRSAQETALWLDIFMPDSQIQLRGSREIGAYQLQIGQLNHAIVALCIQKIHQRSAPPLI